MIKEGSIFTLDTRVLDTFNSKLPQSIDVDESKKVSEEDVNNFYTKVKSGNWIWWKNSQCKYVKVLLVGEECYLFNRHGEQITLEDLEFQHV